MEHLYLHLIRRIIYAALPLLVFSGLSNDTNAQYTPTLEIGRSWNVSGFHAAINQRHVSKIVITGTTVYENQEYYVLQSHVEGIIGTAASRAENILCFFYNICNPAPPAIKSNTPILQIRKETVDELLTLHNSITAMPNPSDEFVQFEFSLLLSKEKTYLNVWDIQGKKIQSWKIGATNRGLQLFDTRKLAPGIYIMELTQEDKKLFSDKFIIQHYC